MAKNEVARVTRAQKAELLFGIYAIVNEGERDPVELTRAALSGGVRVVQYRAKRGIVAERVRAIRELTRDRDALLIMNDDWQAAIAFDCDGVHLGPDDEGFVDPAPVRAIFADGLIGLSCGTVAEVRAVDARAVDYLGVGPVYATGSKADAGEPIGIDGLSHIARATTLRIAAIGGIDRSNLTAVRAAGAAMAAAISAIANVPDAGAAARVLVGLWAGR